VLFEDSELTKPVCEANPLGRYYRRVLQIGPLRLTGGYRYLLKIFGDGACDRVDARTFHRIFSID
jgi:hypothetical protein